jgi:putative hydrolase of HD superfamily
MIKNLIERFYEAAIWTEKTIRPVELTELDKQAHKMVIAYVMAKFEEKDQSCQDKLAETNWRWNIRIYA